MDTTKRERLEEAGFRVGTVVDFLGLTPEESEMVETRVALTTADMTRGGLASRTHPAASGDPPEAGR